MNMKSHVIRNLVKGFFWAVLLFGGVVGLSRITTAQTGEPSREPVLRIEMGMHTAPIWGIGIDRAGKLLVTASLDKTVRVWELSSGRLLRVLRVPIGDGNEGRLYAAAISPDGNTIAAGGWSGNEPGTVSVYLFDRESGRLVRRLSGLPNVVNLIAFSPDGAMMVATFGEANGVCVWRTADWTQALRDKDYGGASYGADFDHSGRLVTSCLDGFLRLYDRDMRLLEKQVVRGGKQPIDVRFSPDGRKVAVGYNDSTRVDVFSGETLSSLYSADTSGVEKGGTLAHVAWSADGSMLYGGGASYITSPDFRIRRWSNEGRGRYVDTPAARGSIQGIAPLPTGGIVYGAGDPSWGVLDAQHKQVQPRQAGQIADYRDSWTNFLTDLNGNTIRFGYELAGKSPAVFQLSTRNLAPDTVESSSLHESRTVAPGLSITDWKSTQRPRLNNAPLKLTPYEMSRSLAIAPDGGRFLLGTEWFVHLFDRSGQELWNTPVPSTAWSVNISGDQRYALAAFGDGTIRWYRMSDGKELLAFFPHADRKRWVLWTPSGYYDASPGGEDLIGWHVNNGRDQAADFFPAGQFRSTYYRPDVIAKILETGDEARTLQLANDAAGRKQQQASIAQQLPPVVEIMSPSDSSEFSSTEIAVRFRVRTPSGEPVTIVKALVDGRPMGARQLVREAATSNADGMRELRVTVPERDSEIAIIAENRFTSSVPATVRVKWRSTTATRPEAFVIKPKLYILAVGVSQYADSKFNLKLADKDAGDFVKAMMAQKDLLYRDVVVKLLTNEKATKDDVLDGLDWIRQETTSNDVAMVFFAGHGVNDQNNYYYFCPYNVDPSRLLRTGVAFSDIKKTVSAIAGKALFFVDSCHSGNAIGLAARRGLLDINIVINELSSAENGVIVFSASTGSESSYEREEWNNGAFTKALVEGLGGAASIGNTGRITYNMLNVYISERVKELTKGQQHPTMISPQTVPDFPIAVKK